MNKSKNSGWIIVAIVAAVIASLTTALIFVLRARAKKRAAWYDEEPDFGYDLEADDNFVLSDEDVAESVE